MYPLIPHSPAAGMICLSEDGSPLGELEREFLLSCVSEHGYVILRGFKADIGEFSRLVRSVSKRISLDPARSFNGSIAQKVDAGYDAVGLHCENGNSPFWPNLCWFYCEQSPSRGSQTTVCDGLPCLPTWSWMRASCSLDKTLCIHATSRPSTGRPTYCMPSVTRTVVRPEASTRSSSSTCSRWSTTQPPQRYPRIQMGLFLTISKYQPCDRAPSPRSQTQRSRTAFSVPLTITRNRSSR